MDHPDTSIISLPTGGEALWESVFLVAGLVLVGTLDPDGDVDLAPKHQAMPLGWGEHYGFVCTEDHATLRNARRTGAFTVSHPTPEQVVAIGQAASPRVDGHKLGLAALPIEPAQQVEGALVTGASLWLECEVDRMIDGFGRHELVVGRVVRAAAPRWAVRDPDRDDAELLRDHPPLAYLAPSRFAAVQGSLAFPFPAGFTR